MIEPPPPTNAHPEYEDGVEHIDIQPLLDGASEDGREVVYAGTDYGICTLSTTMRMSYERFKAHLNLYNYFSVLSNDSSSSSSPIEQLAPEDVELACPKREKCHRITSQDIRQKSLGRILSRRREKRKVSTLFRNGSHTILY